MQEQSSLVIWTRVDTEGGRQTRLAVRKSSQQIIWLHDMRNYVIEEYGKRGGNIDA
jgi:hypothetical protein